MLSMKYYPPPAMYSQVKRNYFALVIHNTGSSAAVIYMFYRIKNYFSQPNANLKSYPLKNTFTRYTPMQRIRMVQILLPEHTLTVFYPTCLSTYFQLISI